VTWIDLHTDILWNMTKVGEDPLGPCRELHCDLPRLEAARVRAAVWAIFIEPETEGPGAMQAALERALCAHDLVARSGGRLRLVRCRGELVDLLDAEQKPGRPTPSGMILGIEGLHPLRGSLELLERFRRLGVRVVTLTWNQGNSFATGCRHPASAKEGLSTQGQHLLPKLGEGGVILDLAHAGPRTLREALEVAQGAVMVSHTACGALRKHPRNLSDEELRLVAARDGLVGITIFPGFLRESSDQPCSSVDVADHIIHAAGVIGIERVALGTDFDGIDRVPADMRGVQDLPVLAEELIRRGLSEADVAKVASENARTFLSGALPEE